MANRKNNHRSGEAKIWKKKNIIAVKSVWSRYCVCVFLLVGNFFIAAAAADADASDAAAVWFIREWVHEKYLLFENNFYVCVACTKNHRENRFVK